ncbi:hypothetical protein RB653_008908 [Dictyostelium firmibasis]|uniref:HTTM-like domain-containing protein n=1 Tax=Dictyostelium firmibasis TaxID=79012 RepID=A0AAN7UDE5_9MYCE
MMKYYNSNNNNNNINNNINNDNNNNNTIIDSDSLQEKFKKGFYLDYRSLALYRIVFSTFLLVDLLLRCQHFTEHYTDEGVYPRSSSIQEERYSLHQLSGSFAFAVLIFLIHGCIYLSMFVGYKTRLSTLLSFVFLCSIQNRNHYLIDGSDDYSRILLFYTIFLPTNKFFSIDSILKEHKEQQQKLQQDNNNNDKNNNINNSNNINNDSNNNSNNDIISTPSTTPSSKINNIKYNTFISGASIAFLVQFMNIYIFTALFKSADTWHVDYSAVYYALNLLQFRHGLAELFLQFPRFLIFLTRGTLIFEYVGPLLLISPFYNTQCRIISILGFIAMHIGFGVCLNLYLFVFIPMVVCMSFLPSDVWTFIKYKYIERKDLITIHYNSNSSQSLQLFLKVFSTFFLVGQNYKIISNNNLGNNNSEKEELEPMDSHSMFYVDSVSIYFKGQIYDEEKSIKFLLQRSFAFFFISKLISDKLYKSLYSYIINFNDINNNQNDHDRKYEKSKLPNYKFNHNNHNHNNNNNNNNNNTTKPTKFKYRQQLKNLFFVVLTTYMFYYNVCVYTAMMDSGRNPYVWQPPFQPLIKLIKIDQYWAMFAPSPPDYSSWIITDSQFSLKKGIDLFTFEETDYRNVPDYLFHIGQRKRNFFLSVGYLDHLRLEFGRYQCRRFNINERNYELGKLEKFKIYAVYQPTPLPPNKFNQYKTLPPTQPTLSLLWEHIC